MEFIWNTIVILLLKTTTKRNHLLHLRLAWVNQKFDALFSEESLVLSLYSPNN